MSPSAFQLRSLSAICEKAGQEAVKESKFSEGERLAGLMCLDSSRGSMSKHIKV
jgi:hypothetical protein